MAIQAARHWSGSRTPKMMAVCAHDLSTATTAGEPFLHQDTALRVDAERRLIQEDAVGPEIHTRPSHSPT